MRLALSGAGECGKDAAGDILKEVSTLRYTAGTSKYAAEIVFDQWGRDRYPDAEECWLDRRNHRQTWAQIIGEYNKNDPVALYRDCLKHQDILAGLRYKHEMLACKEAGLVDLWIWIDRKGLPHDSTIQYGPFECDITIDNNGTLSDLRDRLVRLSKALGVAK